MTKKNRKPQPQQKRKVMVPYGQVCEHYCPECGGIMRLRPSRYGPFYGCDNYPECTATHGAHPDGKPLGVPANRETKQARMAAHAEFDKLWKGGMMTRKEAYKWMQDVMGLSAKTALVPGLR